MLEIPNVFVYAIPLKKNNNTSVNNCNRARAADWDLSKPERICKLVVIATNDLPGVNKLCLLQLVDDDGQVFGESLLTSYPGPGRGFSSKLRPVLDSSRFFTLEIRKRSGERNSVGLGFLNSADSLELTSRLESHFIKWDPPNNNEEVQSYKRRRSDSGPAAGVFLNSNKGTTPKLEIQIKSPHHKLTDKKPETNGPAADPDPDPSSSDGQLIKPPRQKLSEELIQNIIDTTGAHRYKKPGLPYVCHLCPATFDHNINLIILSHWKDFHGLQKVMSHICNNCSLIFRQQTDADYHRYLFHNYKCPVCSTTCDYESGLQNHLFRVHKQRVKYDCKVCHITFDKREDFRGHNTRHLVITTLGVLKMTDENEVGQLYRRPDDSLVCHLCPFTLPPFGAGQVSAGPIRKHWQEAHQLNTSGCLCKLCFLLFSDPIVAAEHSQMFHYFKCPARCPSSNYSIEIRLQTHMLEAHDQFLQYRCEDCKGHYGTRAEFRTHCLETGHFTAVADSNTEEQRPQESRRASKSIPVVVTREPRHYELGLGSIDAKIGAQNPPARATIHPAELPKEIQDIIEKTGAHRYRLPGLGNTLVCHLCPFATCPTLRGGASKPIFDHWETAHRIISKTCVCTMCHLIFPSPAQLREHNHSSHNFVCPHCSKVYFRETGLQNHLLSMHKEPIAPVQV